MAGLVNKMSATATLSDARKGARAKRISEDLGIPTDCLGNQMECRSIRRAKSNSWLP